MIVDIGDENVQIIKLGLAHLNRENTLSKKGEVNIEAHMNRVRSASLSVILLSTQKLIAQKWPLRAYKYKMYIYIYIYVYVRVYVCVYVFIHDSG